MSTANKLYNYFLHLFFLNVFFIVKRILKSYDYYAIIEL